MPTEPEISGFYFAETMLRFMIMKKKHLFAKHIKSIPAEVHLLTHQARKCLESHIASEEKREDILLILGEAAGNMAEHAHQCNPASMTEACIDLCGGESIITVTGAVTEENTAIVKFLTHVITHESLSPDNIDALIRQFSSRELINPGQKEKFFRCLSCSGYSGGEDPLSERGRGLAIIKELTCGRSEFTLDCRHIIHTMHYRYDS